MVPGGSVLVCQVFRLHLKTSMFATKQNYINSCDQPCHLMALITETRMFGHVNFCILIYVIIKDESHSATIYFIYHAVSF